MRKPMREIVSAEMPDFSKITYEYRKSLRLTQAQFGKAVGLTRASIINIESGKHQPSGKLVWLLINRPLEVCPRCEGNAYVWKDSEEENE